MKTTFFIPVKAVLVILLFFLYLAVGSTQQEEGKGQRSEESTDYLEVKWYNNLYSQTSLYDVDGRMDPQDERASFFTSILQLTTVNPSALHFGFDIYFRSSCTGSSNSSPARVFRFRNNQVDALTAFTHLGPKVIWYPMETDRRLLLRSVLLLPLGSNNLSENTDLPFLDNTGFQWWMTAAFNQELGRGLYAYYEAGSVFRFDRRGEGVEDDIFLPFKLFLQYFPVDLPLGLFVFGDYTPTVSGLSSYYMQIGGGLKVYPANHLEIELSTSDFIAGKLSGAGYTINLGLGFRLTKK